MLADHRDLALSTSNTRAAELFEGAIRQFNSYRGDLIGTLDAALAEDEGFVLAHLFKAFALATTSEGRFLPAARDAVARAAQFAAHANPREHALLAAAQSLVTGDWHVASRQFDAVLREWPRDLLALQTAHLLDFYRGDALNLRNRVSRVLPAWSASLPGYSYVLGMHAFGLEECNQYAQAEATGRRALELEPTDGWAVHAVAHVMEMQGRIDEGIAWLTSRQGDWALADNAFAPHNWWHLALFHLDRGEFDVVLDLYDRHIDGPQADMLLVLIDCTAMLWRLHLEGVDVGGRFERVADQWEAKADVERANYAFNDAHAMMSFAATGRQAAGDRLREEMRRTATEGSGINRAMTRDIGLPIAEGVLALAQGRPQQAIEAIEPVRDIANGFGGSHAQRDLLTLTLIEAAVRAGDRNRARHLLAERLVHKPTAWSARLAARIEAGPVDSLKAAA
jgi:tetratricopeptide (TPR) repeat protein